MCPLHRSNTERDCGHQHQHLRGGFCLDCHLLHAGRGTVLGGVHRRRPALLHFHRIGESRFSTRVHSVNDVSDEVQCVAGSVAC